MNKQLNKIISVYRWIDVVVMSKFNYFGYIFVFGLFGFLKYKFIKKINILARYKKIRFFGYNKELYYTNIKLINNLFLSVLSGHLKFLELRGVGFKYKIKKNKLFLILGYSHLITYELPNNIFVKLFKHYSKVIKIFSNNLLLLNKVIYALKKKKIFNIYKGKGIVLKGEILISKEGKKSTRF
jgi:ribosomal protein L6P/L9E